MAFSNTAAILKTPTMLEQLLEEINFQRTKEMRQLLKDDSGFVMLQGTTYWTDLFVRHFLFQNEQTIDCDDLLFFVRKKHVKGTSRYLPKFETEVDVFRKDSRKLPIGDPDIDWEETVYLNLIIHQFDYTLTLAICTRTSPKELQVLKRHSQKVYASPSRRRMDTKGEVEEMTYPHICFMVDNFDEVFCDILVRDGEMVCVELVASDRQGAIQGVIFLGSIRYDALKKVYDARQSSLSSKMAQRMTFGLFSGSSAQRCEFVRMKGPQGKGHAEMAVTKPKGSGVETPTSEPGFCATDMWDSDWDEDPEDFYVYRHQRRLSDPSANLNNFVRGGWKTKLDVASAKSRSENEGLDCMENGVSEIEAGDVRDENGTRPASSRCCGCWKSTSCKRTDSGLSIMSEIYCRSAPAAIEGEPRAPIGPPEPPKTKYSQHLAPPKRCPHHKNVLNKPENDGNISPSKKRNFLRPKSRSPIGSPTSQQCKCTSWHVNNILQRSKSLRENSKTVPQNQLNNILNKTSDAPLSKTRHLSTKCSMRSPIGPITAQQCRCSSSKYLHSIMHQSEYELADDATKVDDRKNRTNANINDEFEYADDAISLNGELTESERPNSRSSLTSLKSLQNSDPTYITVNGKEELPSPEQIKTCSPTRESQHPSPISPQKTEAPETNINSNNLRDVEDSNDKVATDLDKIEIKIDGEEADSFDGNCNPTLSSPLKSRHSSTLPKRKRSSVNHKMWYRPLLQPPHRVTPDGTDIYYWCDMPKRKENELDDGAYNPLWTMRGFTQTFHFWKENKRAQSVPLNAFLTYITLPWWSIAKDILDHREGPILTF